MEECVICGDGFRGFRWTDTHGIGACVNCGAPYTIYHYEGGKRLDKPPECLIKKEFVEATKAYWEARRMNVAPGAFNFPGSSYEVASEEEFKSASEWWAAQKTA